MKDENITLYFNSGSADKVYTAGLKPQAEGWVVNFAYGRRGGSLKNGTKTPDPVEYDVAKKAYDKLVTAKMKKGYAPKPGEGVAPPVTLHGKEAVQTDWIPQLLNQVTYDEAIALWGTFSMYLQTKHDGERRGAWFTKDGQTRAANRRGLEVPLTAEIATDLAELGTYLDSGALLDTEDMGDYLQIFDVISATPGNINNMTFAGRMEGLSIIARAITQLPGRNGIGANHLRVDLPFQPQSIGEFKEFIENARRNNEEGVVIRDGAGTYEPGRPSSGGPVWKLKFYATVTCLVTSVHPTKSSIGIMVQDTSGNCIIPANYSKPNVNDLVEVRYLYAFPGGSLYQPQYEGARTDLTAENFIDQLPLKYKK